MPFHGTARIKSVTGHTGIYCLYLHVLFFSFFLPQARGMVQISGIPGRVEQGVAQKYHQILQKEVRSKLSSTLYFCLSKQS